MIRRIKSKKITEEVQKEMKREMGMIIDRVFRDKEMSGHFNMEALEMTIHSCMYHGEV